MERSPDAGAFSLVAALCTPEWCPWVVPGAVPGAVVKLAGPLWRVAVGRLRHGDEMHPSLREGMTFRCMSGPHFMYPFTHPPGDARWLPPFDVSNE